MQGGWRGVAAVALPAMAWGAVSGPGTLAGREMLLPQIRQAAMAQGVPPALADVVAVVETGYAVNAVGSSGEVGLMQILPSTAALMGFQGPVTDLFAPATNIRFAVAYLARAWSASGGHVCRALMKYRAGLREERYSPLSINYCRRAAGWLASTGSSLAVAATASIPAAADMADPPGAGVVRLVDLSALPGLAGMPDLVVQRMRVRADGLVVQPIRRRAQAAVDAALAE